MLLRIIDKETKLFLRDDFTFNVETEQGISTICPQGFNQPKWVEPTEDEEVGYWVEA
jgi:hypothetical protein